MKVKYPGLWLAGDPSDPSQTRRATETLNLQITPDFLVQWIEGLRAPTATAADRYNDRVELRFSVNRYFTSIQAAETFYLTHYSALRSQRVPGNPALGLSLQLILENNANMYVSNALVKVRPRSEIGVSLLLGYEVYGSAISSNPNSTTVTAF